MKARTDYETGGISKLNELCAPYGKGIYATGARCITIEDVDRITGYDKTNYGKGTLYEYGNVITYKYNGTLYPSYESSNGVNGTLTEKYSDGFYWYDAENVYHNVTASDLTNANNIGKEIGQVTSTYYSYSLERETDLKTKSVKAYNMLTKTAESLYQSYWIAWQWSYSGTNDASFGLCYGGYAVVDVLFFYSRGRCTFEGGILGVRAVVTLSATYTPNT